MFSPPRIGPFVPFLALPFLFFLGGCGVGGSSPVPRSNLEPVVRIVTLSDEAIKAVKAGVRSRLRDPQSAIFGSMIAGVTPRSESLLNVCGWVNAKNPFGGYVGDKPFVGSLYFSGLGHASFDGVFMGGSDRETRIVHIMCSDLGLRL